MLHAILADTNYSFWLPEQASKTAADVDFLFNIIMGICIFFSTLIMAGLIVFVVKYRHRENRPHDPTAGHSTALELTWTIIPTLMCLVLFYYGFRGYLHASVMPPNAYEVTASGKMWNWSFNYPTGLTDGELHLVVNKPTRIVLESADVIHDLDVPAFRIKKDAVPGRYNRTWFEPTRKGVYDVYCAMYCGQNHSTMRATCVVEDQADFDKWMEQKSNWADRMSFIDRGKELYRQRGCITCHSVDGPTIVGPTWKDMYGSMVPLTGGGSVRADDAYVEESILEPAAKIVAGFQNVMPSFKGQLKPNDIQALTWYMKSISKEFKGDLTPGQTIAVKLRTSGPATSPVTQPAAVPGAMMPKRPIEIQPGQ